MAPDKKGKNKQSTDPVPPQEAPQQAPEPADTQPETQAPSPNQQDPTSPQKVESPQDAKTEPVPEIQPTTQSTPAEEDKSVPPRKKGSVDSLLIELLEASHDALDGYSQLNRDKVVHASKVYESNVPRILTDIEELKSLTDEDKTRLRSYLERARDVKFLERYEESANKGAPKLKDVIVDETNFDELVAKIAHSDVQSFKKNLNAQWKILEESTAFKQYLATKPVVEAPEVSQLKQARQELEDLRASFRGLQEVFATASKTIRELWVHKAENVSELGAALDTFGSQLKGLNSVGSTDHLSQDLLRETDLLKNLSTAQRPATPTESRLQTELEDAQTQHKAEVASLQTQIQSLNQQLESARTEVDAAKHAPAEADNGLSRELDDLRASLATTTEEAHTKSQELVSIKQVLATLQQEKDDAVSQLKTVTEERDTARVSSESANYELKALQTLQGQQSEVESLKSQNLNEQIAQLEAQLAEANSKLTDLEQTKAALVKAHADLEKKITELAAAQLEAAKVPTLTETITSQTTTISDLQSSLAQATSDKTHLQTELAQKSQADELQQQASSTEQAKQLQTLTTDLESTKSALQAAETKLASQASTNTHLTSTITTLEAEISSLKASHLSATDGLARELSAVRTKLAASEHLVQQLREEHVRESQAVMDQFKETKRKAEELHQRVAHLNKLLEEEQELKRVAVEEGEKIKGELEQERLRSSTLQSQLSEKVVLPEALDTSGANLQLFDSQVIYDESVREAKEAAAKANQELSTKIKELEHEIKQVTKESQEYKTGQEEQFKVVTEKDEKLKELQKKLEELSKEHATEKEAWKLKMSSALEEMNTGWETKYESLKTKYKTSKQQSGQSRSGTSTPGITNISESNRSALHSIQKTIEEQPSKEDDAIGSQAQEHLGLFNQPIVESAGVFDSQVSPGAKPDEHQPTFSIDDEILDPLVSGFAAIQQSQGSFISDGSVGKRYGPVSAHKMEELEAAMVKLSQYWASKKPKKQQTSQLVGTGQEGANEPEFEEEENTLASILAQKEEEIETLESNNQSLNQLVVRLVTASTNLVTGVLGPQVRQGVEGYALHLVGEELTALLEQKILPKFHEYHQSIQSLTLSNQQLQAARASAEESYADLHKVHTDLQNEYQTAYTRLATFESLVESVMKVFSSAKAVNSFSSQDPIKVLNSITEKLETDTFPVDLWKGGLARGFAHVIKDLLRRIIAIIPDLHKVAPNRNATWINTLLNIISSVELGVDDQLKEFKTNNCSDSLESYLQQLQRIVSTKGSQAVEQPAQRMFGSQLQKQSN